MEPRKITKEQITDLKNTLYPVGTALATYRRKAFDRIEDKDGYEEFVDEEAALAFEKSRQILLGINKEIGELGEPSVLTPHAVGLIMTLESAESKGSHTKENIDNIKKYMQFINIILNYLLDDKNKDKAILTKINAQFENLANDSLSKISKIASALGITLETQKKTAAQSKQTLFQAVETEEKEQPTLPSQERQKIEPKG